VGWGFTRCWAPPPPPPPSADTQVRRRRPRLRALRMRRTTESRAVRSSSMSCRPGCPDRPAGERPMRGAAAQGGRWLPATTPPSAPLPAALARLPGEKKGRGAPPTGGRARRPAPPRRARCAPHGKITLTHGASARSITRLGMQAPSPDGQRTRQPAHAGLAASSLVRKQLTCCCDSSGPATGLVRALVRSVVSICMSGHRQSPPHATPTTPFNAVHGGTTPALAPERGAAPAPSGCWPARTRFPPS